MWKTLVLLASTGLVCLALLGCTGDPSNEMLAPVPGELTPDRLASKSKTTSIRITVPAQMGLNPALVPPVSTLRWAAERTKWVRWILVSTVDFDSDWEAAETYIRENPDAPEWSGWQRYKPRKNEGTYWQTPPLDFGPYVFAVQSEGPSGDTTDIVLGQTVVRLLVSNRTTEPGTGGDTPSRIKPLD